MDLKTLTETKLYSEFVSIGSYAINKIISGRYDKGIPIGAITQIIGNSSTGKTVFATSILKHAQKAGYYSILVDSENAYNPKFAESLGLDVSKLYYSSPPTLEDCFEYMENSVKVLRAKDKTTPIVIAYDSVAVSPIRKELEVDKDGNATYIENNMLGAMRAKQLGMCVRKINTVCRDQKVALVIINQFRNKVGVMYGDPNVAAAGGMALEYYLSVNLKTHSNKTSDLIKDDENKDEVLGIQGTVATLKNKVSMPFKKTDFKLMFEQGLDPYAGLMDLLVADGMLDKGGAGWTTVKANNFKFQAKELPELLADKSKKEFDHIRQLLENQS